MPGKTGRPRPKKWKPCPGCGTLTHLGKVCSTCAEAPPAPEPEPEPAPEAATNGSTRRRRRIESGWCMSERHGRCPELLQEANAHRPEIHCACRCHSLTRNMAWAKAR